MKYRLLFCSFSKIQHNLARCSFKKISSKVPGDPIRTLEKVETQAVKIDRSTLALLERLSLVKYNTPEGIKVLEDSINFANKILHIDTDKVEPLYSVLENENLNLRTDKITQGNCQKDILKNASVIEDEYFVAPIGNIPLHEVEVEEGSISPLEKQNENWLRFIYGKTFKHMTIYLDKSKENLRTKALPCGIISVQLPDYTDQSILHHKLDCWAPENDTQLEFNIFVPRQDFMQYFIKWQRYRKFWWSSVTTTPSLFRIDDIQQINNEARVNILAQFSSGTRPVEIITVNSSENGKELNNSVLKCTMSIEGALLTILLDGITNDNNEEYLRLHRKIAPYKFAFAVDTDGVATTKNLDELASLLHYKLSLQKITSLLPNFSLPLDLQIKECLHIGIPYTGILTEATLENGIFKLMSSSTMLMEQVHVADFDTYAAILCSEK